MADYGGGYGGYEYGSGGGYMGGGFDPMGGGNGGGFGGDMGGGGFIGDGGSGQKGDGKKKKFQQTITPVTIKQVINCESRGDDLFAIDSVEVDQVKIVGWVENYTERSTNIEIQLNDGTGRFNFKLFVDKAEVNNHETKFRTGTMHQIIGPIKMFNDIKSILIHSNIEISELDALTYHMLEVIYIHCQRTKGPVPGSTSSIRTNTPNPKPHMGTPQQQLQSFSGSSNVLKEVTMKAFTNCTDMETGCNITDVISFVMSELKNSVQVKDITKMIESLSDDGMIYSTIDELHYLPSE